MDKVKLVIYGNGHIARMVCQFAGSDFDVVAFTVDRVCIKDNVLDGLPLIPFDQIEHDFPPDSHSMLIAVGFIEMNSIRMRKFDEAKLKGYSFVNYIHSSVVLHDNLEIGENNIILDFVSLHPFTKIGNSNFISSNSNFGHGCSVGDNCWFNAGVSIAGETTIGNNCCFGVNASSNHHLLIAEKSFIGANTYVNQDTEPGGVYLSESCEKFRLDSEAFLHFMKVF